METEVEERSVSIVFNLLQNQGPKGGRKERVAAKFVESEFEKCDRLMELYFRQVNVQHHGWNTYEYVVKLSHELCSCRILRYATRVAAQEAKLAARDEEEDEDEDEEVGKYLCCPP